MAKVTKEIDKGFKKVIEELKKMDMMKVTVGVHEGAGEYPNKTPIALVALTQEFGTNKAGKNKDVVIPARSFMRSTVDKSTKKWQKLLRELFSEVMTGKNTTEKALKEFGLTAQAAIQGKIIKLRKPPNAPSTKAQKLTANPLLDSKLMLRSISTEVNNKEVLAATAKVI